MQRPELTLFEPHIDTVFTASDDAIAVELTLRKVEKSGNARGDFQPFALVFEAQSDIHLAQQTLTLTHDELDDVTLFIVPISIDDGKMFYESIFN